jgi:cell division protein FtsB
VPAAGLGKTLSGSRWLIGLLALAGLGLQANLWFADDGYRKTLNLRAAVAEQRELNEELRTRNAALDAEVVNLKQGRDAAEERARTDLGMIGKTETFYQVVPVAEAR